MTESQAFSDVLDKMRDKIEFGLKVLWEREKVIAALEPIGDRMILKAAFLVDRSQEPAFDERVKEISVASRTCCRSSILGPWPPYNFVNIKLKLEKAD